MTGQITFTKEKMQSLEASYQQALREGKKQFTFEGHELLTDYAKYVLMYLKTTFKQGGYE